MVWFGFRLQPAQVRVLVRLVVTVPVYGSFIKKVKVWGFFYRLRITCDLRTLWEDDVGSREKVGF